MVTRVTPWLRLGYALRVTIQPSHTKDLKAKNVLVTPVTPKIIKLFFSYQLTTPPVPSSELLPPLHVFLFYVSRLLGVTGVTRVTTGFSATNMRNRYTFLMPNRRYRAALQPLLITATMVVKVRERDERLRRPGGWCA